MDVKDNVFNSKRNIENKGSQIGHTKKEMKNQ
jgi:hypothetical protein